MAQIAPFRSSHSCKAKARRVKEEPKQRHQQSLAARSKDALSSIHSHTTDGRSAWKSTENSRLAPAVTKQAGGRHFTAAIRIICSSDAPAQVNHDTLQALHIIIIIIFISGYQKGHKSPLNWPP